MRALLTLVTVLSTLCIAGAKVETYRSLAFAGGDCWSCQDSPDGLDCCNEGSKPTEGARCTGGTNPSENDCSGAKGRFCTDSGVEQTKSCDDSTMQDCTKGFEYKCTAGAGDDGPTPPVWVKGAQDVNCGKQRLCSMK